VSVQQYPDPMAVSMDRASTMIDRQKVTRISSGPVFERVRESRPSTKPFPTESGWGRSPLRTTAYLRQSQLKRGTPVRATPMPHRVEAEGGGPPGGNSGRRYQTPPGIRSAAGHNHIAKVFPAT